jgi:EpsI family protein
VASTSIRTAAGTAFLVALAVVAAANGEALHALLRQWMFGGLDYGFVILAISVLLLWRTRARVRDVRVAPDWRGLWLVIPIGIATSLAYLLDVRIAQYVLFIASVATLIGTLLGFATLRIAAGPLALLLLAMPIWNYFKPALQAMTVRVIALALELTGTPVFVDETYIYTPHRAILVLASCSGAQFLQAGLTLGALHAYLNFRRARVRMMVIADFAFMALVGNWVRVYALVFLRTFSGDEHFVFGWAMFGVMLIPAFFLASRLRRYESRLSARTASGPHAPEPDRIVSALTDRPALAKTVAIAAITASLLIIGPVLASNSTAVSPATGMLRPIGVRPPWSGPFGAQTGWKPSFRQFDAEAMGAYRMSDQEVVGYWVFYANQNQVGKVVNELNTVYDPAHWRPRGGYAGTDYRQVALEGEQVLNVVETRLENLHSGAERLVWHWYRVDGREVVRPWQAKFAQLAGLVHGRRDAVAVVLSTNVTDLAEARHVLRDFVRTNIPRLRTMPETSASQP